MGPKYSSPVRAAARRLKQEIERLTSEHSRALQKAVYLGMSPKEMEQSEERRKLIGKYVHALQLLESEN